MSSYNSNNRISFASIKNQLEYPDFLEVQLKSFKDFFQLGTTPENRKNEGLYTVFKENFPITDTRNNFVLEFLDYFIDPPRYTIEECLGQGLTYGAPLKAKLKLYCTDPEHEDFDTVIEDVYLGNVPYMTPKGTFVINGAERVVVSQLHRSPGVFFGQSIHANGTKLYSARIIPFKGSWIEFATDINNVMYAYIDRKKKLPVTTLLRAIGFETDKDILEIFGLADEVNVSRTGLKKVVGRRLAARVLKSWIEDFVDEDTGEVVSIERNEIIVDRETVLEPEHIDAIVESGAKTILLHKEMQNLADYAIIYNTLQKDPCNSEKEAVLHIYRQLRSSEPPDEATARDVIDKLFFSDKRYDLGDVGRYKLNKKLGLATDPDIRVLTKEDIIEIIKYLIRLLNAKTDVDDIDHLSNRRVRTVGEQLYNQFGVGLARMARTIRERMNVRDNEVFTPVDLINSKILSSVINSFFGTNALSQFMDQTNPLAEITHKRRMSALGPGGLSRDRAGFEVRDVHYSHYGRMCPIETPEGPNIGLINSLACYARINEYGFVEAPYRKIDKTDPKNPRVTDEVVYMTADEEDNYHVAQANEALDAEGHFVRNSVSGRYLDETQEYEKTMFDYMDVSPKMVFSVATALIPFLQNDDANRALMGSNMQRQAVPLLTTEAPVVGTGMETKAAVDSGVCVVAKKPGTVESSVSNEITIRNDDGTREVYRLTKFSRSNQSNCYNQRPVVFKGDHVEAGEVIADGPSTSQGELALGKNPLIGFMTWEGYNYEDAVLLSERLVQDDVYTSIHIEEYEAEARDTKLGPEEITRDVPGVGDDALKDLDERGIIRIGAEVRAGDILVGKVTPKGETELTAEERLLRAIFGEKAREVRDTSLKVPHGEYGIIVDAKVFTRENGDELSPGVNQAVRIYIAQKRKISVGDKMAGRHGNKGVVSRVLPVEDMPFLPNGRPLDIVLNPLGVPSRMNIGQVLEIHLSLAAKALGFNIETPVFDGAKENDIMDTLDLANDYVNLEWDEFEAKHKDELLPEVLEYLSEHREHRKLWKGVPISRDGKVRLRDGRTGEFFDSPVTIGHMHYLKLHHLVDDKIHARSTGPYSLVTQQPLGGKAQFGGQRFGEMEVWALEAYGAAYTLQEILTVKSDDVVGRVKTYEAIIKGDNIPEPGIPESFKVLLKELQSLGLDVKVLDEERNEVELMETSEYGNTDLNAIIAGDKDFAFEDSESFGKMGFTKQEFDAENEELVDVDEEDVDEDDDFEGIDFTDEVLDEE